MPRKKTDLVVVDNVDPWENVDEQLGVSRVSSSHTLDIVGYLRSAIQWLAFLHLVDHFPHVHFNLPGVLGETVETFCGRGEQLYWDRIDRYTYGKNAGRGREGHRSGRRQLQDASRAQSHHGPHATGSLVP
jgi:hypothetical protein